MQRTTTFSFAFAALAILLSGCDASSSLEPGEDSGLTPSQARSSQSGPAAPSSVAAIVVSSTRIDVLWSDNATNETGFEVHRAKGGENPTYALVVTTAENVTAHEDRSIGSPGEYCYRIRAVQRTGKKIGYSAYSDTSCAATVAPADTMIPPPPAPAVPSNVTAVVASEIHIRVNWQDNSNDESGFLVSIYGFNPWHITGPDVVTALSYPMTPGEQRCFYVQAFRKIELGNGASGTVTSAPSDTACATIPPPADPPASYVVSVSPSSSSSIDVKVTWPYTSIPPAYRTYWSVGGSSWTELPAYHSVPSETEVCYYVIAFNMAGDGQPSNTACATAPDAPTNLVSIGVAGDSLALTWVDNSAVEEGFQVIVIVAQGSPDNAGLSEYEWGSVVLPANSTKWRTPRLDPQPYESIYYYIVAIRDGGRSNGTDAVSATSSP